MKIYTQQYLIQKLKLKKLYKNRSQYKYVSNSIKKFYLKKGYSLVKTYFINETRNFLSIHVDEGRLEKIVFHNINSIDIIRIKYEFNLQDKIYNKYRIKKEIKRLKKKFDFKSIHERLTPSKKFDNTLFQLNRKFELPLLGETQIPFIEKNVPRYDLEIIIKKKPTSRAREISYGFKTSYIHGLIPFVKYPYPNFISKRDLLASGASMGIYYGLDGNFTEYPRMKYIEAHSNYYFPPTLKKFFTPLIKGQVYNSKSSRSDLGLSQYNYLQFRGILVPGITILKKLKIFFGYGIERVYIQDTKNDDDAEYNEVIEPHVDNWQFIESRIVLNLIPWSIKRMMKRKFSLKYNYYMNNKSFHEIIIKGETGFYFKNNDIYLLKMDYTKILKHPPFYHEEGVSNSRFRGFMGDSYHSTNLIRISNEYMISLYRDFIYGGLFLDMTRFKGSGYDLSGNQYGFVTGISGHFIFLDHFEFNIYYGRDYLFSTNETNPNIYFELQKKKW
ncbi:MAG: hypothetical protein SVR08_10240 [Spirochaetota bacterium]|nr:hypothetical protein [Spirochaetota bacterium]